jgi:hypothetical protein
MELVFNFRQKLAKTAGPPLAVPTVGGYPNERSDTRKNLLAAMSLFASKERLMSQTNQEEKVRNVVLVHGGFVDGSGWEGVYNGESHPFVKRRLPMRNSR